MRQRQEVQEVLPPLRGSPAAPTGSAVRRAPHNLDQSAASQIRSPSRRLRLLIRSRVSGGTIPAHAAAARSSRSAASIEGLSGSPYRVCCEESAPQPGPISSFSEPFSLATLTLVHWVANQALLVEPAQRIPIKPLPGPP